MVVRYLANGRVRVLAFTVSLVGVVVLSLTTFFRPTPSILVINAPPPHLGKVSVALCSENGSVQEIVTAGQEVHRVMKQLRLEFELLVVMESRSNTKQLLRQLPSGGHYHFELVPLKQDCTHSFVSAIQRAHFSVLMLLGVPLTEYDHAIPELVQPVLQGEADLVLADDSTESADLWKGILSLLLFPLSGRRSVPSSLVLSINRVVWSSVCSDVGGIGSLSVELVTKCSLIHWETVPVQTSSSSSSSVLSLTQVLWIYWSLHPAICILAPMLTLIVLALLLRWCQRHDRTRLLNI